ncbi:MAG: GIY-YIG nuclease family protein [Maribacter sp.]
MKSYFVYILRCSDDSFYTGITGNFDQRWIQYQQGHFKDCYTYYRSPLKIDYYLEFTDVIQAILFEKNLRAGQEKRKLL